MLRNSSGNTSGWAIWSVVGGSAGRARSCWCNVLLSLKDRRWNWSMRPRMGSLMVGMGELSSSRADTCPWAVLPDAALASGNDNTTVMEVGKPGRRCCCLTGLVLPDGTRRLVELLTGDGVTRVSPCRSGDLEAKRWAKMPRIGGLKGVSEGLVVMVQAGQVAGSLLRIRVSSLYRTIWGVGRLLRRLASAGVGDRGRSELMLDSSSILSLLICIGQRLSVLGSFLGSVSLVSGRTTCAPRTQPLLIRFIVCIAAWWRLWYMKRSSGVCRCSFGSQEL